MADLQGVGGLVETLKAEVERLKNQLAAADALASDEAAKTAQAITAFEALAQRLEAMAEAKRPSWWRWLRFAD
jgi:two-component sensor histidine kinase